MFKIPQITKSPLKKSLDTQETRYTLRKIDISEFDDISPFEIERMEEIPNLCVGAGGMCGKLS